MRPTFLSALVLTFFSSSLLAQTPLQNEIRKIAADAHATVSCSLPGSSLNCDLEPQSHPPMPSVFKLPLAVCALHQIEQGKFSLDQPIRFLPSDLFPQGTFSPLQDKYPSANVDVPLRELLRLAASLSDNAAADIVLRLVGGPTVVDAYIKSLGVAGFHLEDGEHGLHRDPTAQYRNWFEPAGAVQFLRKLSDNSPLSPEHTELLLAWMKDSPTGPNRIKGALFAGFAGASGYYAGSVFFGQRPTRLLMLNIVIGSVLTFFFIHYLAYITLDIAGKTSAITFRSQNIWTLQSGPRRWSFASTAQTREAQVNLALSGTSLRCCRSFGFAVGGFCVYAYLAAKPYCTRCSCDLPGKGKQIRYAKDPEGLQTATAQLAVHMANGDVRLAVEERGNSAGFGASTIPKACRLRSVVEVQHCKKCERHWVKFTVENLSGNDWKEVSGLTDERFTEQPVNIGKP